MSLAKIEEHMCRQSADKPHVLNRSISVIGKPVSDREKAGTEGSVV